MTKRRQLLKAFFGCLQDKGSSRVFAPILQLVPVKAPAPKVFRFLVTTYLVSIMAVLVAQIRAGIAFVQVVVTGENPYPACWFNIGIGLTTRGNTALLAPAIAGYLLSICCLEKHFRAIALYAGASSHI